MNDAPKRLMQISEEAAQHALAIMRQTWPYREAGPPVIRTHKETTMALPKIDLKPTPWKFVRPDEGDDYFQRTYPDGKTVRFDIQSGRKTTINA